MNHDRESSSHDSFPPAGSNRSSGTMPAGSSDEAGSRRSSTTGLTAGFTTATVTLTQEATQTNEEVLRLTLHPRPQVRWDENVVDNEGLGRKSSKRCCIFHKQRAFDESSTDSSEEDADGSDDEGEGKSGRKKSRKVTRPKKGDNVPDYQRFHA